jgi:hypothetical protein
MAQVVSRWPLTAEAWVLSWLSLCEICSGQSDTVTGLSPISSALPCQYHSTVALHTRIRCGMNNKPAGGRSSET